MPFKGADYPQKISHLLGLVAGLAFAALDYREKVGFWGELTPIEWAVIVLLAIGFGLIVAALSWLGLHLWFARRQ